MMLLKLIIIFLLVFIFFNLRNFLKLNRKQKVLKAKKLTTFNKKNLNNWMNLTKKERYNLSKQNLNNWMNLTKKERYNLSKQDSVKYVDRRKLLLEEIRKEYKKISRENLEGNIKKK